jgi:hypothetical protein
MATVEGRNQMTLRYLGVWCDDSDWGCEIKFIYMVYKTPQLFELVVLSSLSAHVQSFSVMHRGLPVSSLVLPLLRQAIKSFPAICAQGVPSGLQGVQRSGGIGATVNTMIRMMANTTIPTTQPIR